MALKAKITDIDNKTKKIFTISMLMMILSVLWMPNSSLIVSTESETNSISIQDGSFLEYEVKIPEFKTNNGSTVHVGASSSFQDDIKPITATLRIEYQINDTSSDIHILFMYFSMQGSGYLYYTQEVQGPIDFDYSYTKKLVGTNGKNSYNFENGTFWGYLPFIINPVDRNNFSLSGTPHFLGETIIGSASSGTTYVELPNEIQECYLVSPKADEYHFTVYGLEKLKLVPAYKYDKSSDILLFLHGMDSFWTIFNREICIRSEPLVLSETNLDLGPASTISGLGELLPVIFLPMILLVTGTLIFILVKIAQRTQKK